MTDLYTKTNYTAPVSHLISTYIREYDISKANINILFKYGAISKEKYEYYYNLDKLQRQIEIGLLLRNKPQFSEVLKNGIIDAKRNLFSANNIQDYEILSIKNDAVFLIGKIPSITKFDNIEFACKNVYTSFYNIMNKEFYYLYDTVNKIEKIDIKGMSDESVDLHKDYFLDFLLALFCSAQTEQIEDTMDLLKSFYNDYKKRKLDINYYRRFDAQSAYDVCYTRFSVYRAKTISPDQINNINISYNLDFLSRLVKIYSGIYFSYKK